MLKGIKQRLLENPESIVNILITYEFSKPIVKNNEIRFGLQEGSNPNGISIRLHNNENLYVNDYIRGINADLINYIIKVKNSDFRSVLSVIKTELGIESFYDISTQRQIFGGFYNRISKYNDDLFVKTYPYSILDDYIDSYSERFAKDNINVDAQDRFQLRYDVISQRIVFPVYNKYAELIGIKGRADWDVDEDESKYLYLVNCPMSSTLYGYTQNFTHLQDGEILIFEAEKSVMQCSSYGIYNAVALGSHSLSQTQCKMLMELSPKKIVFLFDKGLDLGETTKNIKALEQFTRMSDVQIYYWDWEKSTVDLPEKASPSDCGKEKLKYILKHELVHYNEESEDEFII